MKYEMIFGDEKLFDGAPNDAEAVSCVDGFNKLYYKFKSGSVFISSPSCLQWQEREAFIVHCMMSAMRRIIQEPKRWTAEDQKAGRLPEVGAEFKTSIGKRKCVITEGKFIFTVYDGSVEVFTIDSAMPLETPEEKAERLRSEWCAKAAKTLKNLEYTSTLTSIYDALLSGELTMPSKDGE